jgi:hypothetical protein
MRLTIARCGLLGGVAAVWLISAAGPAAAEVFRCEGPDGRTVYADTPCPKGALVAREISRKIGLCATEACEEKRRAQAQAAQDGLREDKAELARLQELRIRQEEAWARVLAARQAAEAAIAAYASPPEEPPVIGFYPVRFPHRHARFHGHRRECRLDAGCPGGARQGHTLRVSVDRRASQLRIAMDR